MPPVQDIQEEKRHYEELFRRAGDHHFIGTGYDWIHARTVELLKPGARILDVGCGTGHHARLFARMGFDVAGIELSPTAVHRCREAFETLGLTGEFACGDVRDLPFEDQSFDACFLSLILHHVPDYPRVLAEAARVSRRYVFVFEPNARNPQSYLLLNVVNRLARPSFLTPNQRAVNPARVRTIMAACGYQQRAIYYATLRSTGRPSVWKTLVYGMQRALPGCMRHSKFVQVFESGPPFA